MNCLFGLVYTGVVYCWGHSEGLAHGVTVFLIQLLSFYNFCFLEWSDPNKKVWRKQSIFVNMCQYVWDVLLMLTGSLRYYVSNLFGIQAAEDKNTFSTIIS